MLYKVSENKGALDRRKGRATKTQQDTLQHRGGGTVRRTPQLHATRQRCSYKVECAHGVVGHTESAQTGSSTWLPQTQPVALEAHQEHDS